MMKQLFGTSVSRFLAFLLCTDVNSSFGNWNWFDGMRHHPYTTKKELNCTSLSTNTSLNEVHTKQTINQAISSFMMKEGATPDMRSRVDVDAVAGSLVQSLSIAIPATSRLALDDGQNQHRNKALVTEASSSSLVIPSSTLEDVKITDKNGLVRKTAAANMDENGSATDVQGDESLRHQHQQQHSIATSPQKQFIGNIRTNTTSTFRNTSTTTQLPSPFPSQKNTITIPGISKHGHPHPAFGESTNTNNPVQSQVSKIMCTNTTAGGPNDSTTTACADNSLFTIAKPLHDHLQPQAPHSPSSPPAPANTDTTGSIDTCTEDQHHPEPDTRLNNNRSTDHGSQPQCQPLNPKSQRIPELNLAAAALVTGAEAEAETGHGTSTGTGTGTGPKLVEPSSNNTLTMASLISGTSSNSHSHSNFHQMQKSESSTTASTRMSMSMSIGTTTLNSNNYRMPYPREDPLAATASLPLPGASASASASGHAAAAVMANKLPPPPVTFELEDAQITTTQGQGGKRRKRNRPGSGSGSGSLNMNMLTTSSGSGSGLGSPARSGSNPGLGSNSGSASGRPRTIAVKSRKISSLHRAVSSLSGTTTTNASMDMDMYQRNENSPRKIDPNNSTVQDNCASIMKDRDESRDVACSCSTSDNDNGDIGSESGYEGSASSNDASGISSQCGSGSGSDSSQHAHTHTHTHGHKHAHGHGHARSPSGTGTGSGSGKSPRLTLTNKSPHGTPKGKHDRQKHQHRQHPSSSCSSDIADFSSAGSDCSFPRVSPFLGPLSEWEGSAFDQEDQQQHHHHQYNHHTHNNTHPKSSSGRKKKKHVQLKDISSSHKRELAPLFPSAAMPMAMAAPSLISKSVAAAAASAASDSYPNLKRSHRRRRAAARGRDRREYNTNTIQAQPPNSHTHTHPKVTSFRTVTKSGTNSGSGNGSGSGSMEHSSEYVLPDTWSFVERKLKQKMTYEEHRKELKANYRSAVKRIDRNINSDGSTSSVKSSLTANSYAGPGSPQYALPDPPEIKLYDFGVDIMANILTYLEPVDTYTLLSKPLSKEFRMTFNLPQDLWKVLCLSEPFYAKADEGQDSDNNSIGSYPGSKNISMGVKQRLGKYRLLYSSLIKCVLYLNRVKEDARNGRTPSGAYDSDGSGSVGSAKNYEDNNSLLGFFANVHKMKKSNSSSSCSDVSSSDGQGKDEKEPKKNKLKYGVSKLTRNLLGPALGSRIAGNVSLPWSCAIYSVVNWMVAFTDVVGIQLMCLKVLPDLLVNEEQRTSAQHAGLTDIVLRAMVLFPDVVELHTAAFHTLVLLARPLGGKEGMLFNSAMVNASGIFNVGSNTGKSGIAIMLDSMKRFVDDEDLMAMSCWSMVNIALIPSQKVVLVRLGGISAAVHAMLHHPKNAEVQFRALFALINLVIPSENLAENSVQAVAIQVGSINQDTEIEMLDDSTAQVTNLVVVAMKNFCLSEPILNRACLVLHNLSLNEAYHRVLLLTPNCYQMLEWCIGNYRTDEVLQRSARGTLTRLQMTLSGDPTLRAQFTAALREQKQYKVGENVSNQEVPQLDVSMMNT